jgi:hypothetical protein
MKKVDVCLSTEAVDWFSFRIQIIKFSIIL